MALVPTRTETAANWAASNPVLANNEVGIESDTGKVKVGDGIRRWSALPVADNQQTSAQFAASISNETGTGAAVLATSPTLVTPALGTPTSVVLTNATGLPISTGVSGLGAGVATVLANAPTGTGSPVAATSPTLVTPALGTPTSVVLTNATGLPISTGVSGLGAGVATVLANAPTGTGSPVAATSPTVATPNITGVTGTGGAAPTIASAATIAPTTSIIFVSGTTSIATITPPPPIDTKGGTITIIPTGLFSTLTTGNIALASTAVVSKALLMVYDPTAVKWYPSY